jgi:hypothetical protein
LRRFTFVIESSERCNITTAENPGDSSPCAAVKGIVDSKFFCADKVPHFIKRNLRDFVACNRFCGIRSRFVNPAVNQGAIATENLSAHVYDALPGE